MRWQAVALFLALTACAAAVAIDAGCDAYGEVRLNMPQPLGDGPLAAWVAVLDSRMTKVCRG